MLLSKQDKLAGMLRNVVLTLALALQVGPVAADGNGEAAMRAVIETQLAAFRSGDAETAYAQASPEIHSIFPNTQVFFAMVRVGYAALIAPREVRYLGAVQDNGQPVYRVLVEGRGGQRWMALYQMSQQPAGEWLISGCVLVRLAGELT